MKVSFIGDSQMVTLCFFMQELFRYNDDYNSTAQWLLYGDEFLVHLDSWADKCERKMLDYGRCVAELRTSDVVVFQEICADKSVFCNAVGLRELTSPGCRLLKLPSVHMDYSRFEESLAELARRETLNAVDVSVSDLFRSSRDRQRQDLMLSIVHPTSKLFLHILVKICARLNILGGGSGSSRSSSSRAFFDIPTLHRFIRNPNYMGLPNPHF